MTADNSHPPKLGFSIKEACQATSLGKTTIYALIAAGRLRSISVGTRAIITAESLMALMNGEAGPPPPSSDQPTR